MIEIIGEFRNPKKRMILIGTGVGAAVVLIVGGFFLWDYMKLKSNPNAANEETSARIVQQVSNIYQVPDEKPTVAQVQDKEKLKGQAFFDKAENGDYLLIYAEAKIAMIYREKTHKLVNAGPVNLPDNQQNATPQGTEKK
jgi:hypothetical protein